MRSPKLPLAVVTALAVLASVPPIAGAAPGVPARWEKGFNWTQWWNDAYSSAQAQMTLDGLAATGANAVAFIPTYYTDCVTCTDMALDPARSPSDENLRTGVRRAQAMGLKTFFRPLLDVEGGIYRGSIEPSDPDVWWENYRRFVYRYAELAERTGVDQLSVGTELTSMTGERFDAQWRALIAGVRARYSGALTFGANWDAFDSVTFWDALDSIGIDAYFPLGTGTTPDEAAITRAWSDFTDAYGQRHRYLAELEALAAKWDRLIVFHEVGFPANTRSLVEPWSDGGGTYDGDAQARSITATLVAFADKPWFGGVYLWNWMATTGAGGPGDTSATIQGKPAERSITEWFRSPFEPRGPDLAGSGLTRRAPHQPPARSQRTASSRSAAS